MSEARSSPTARAEGGPAGRRLPAGVVLQALGAHGDARGTVAEIYRASWPTGIAPVQWSTTVTRGGELRGVHVHIIHDDYLCLLQGRLSVGLRDFRPGSPTEALAVCFDLRGDELASLFIPHGVAHGLYAHEPSVYVLGTSHYFDPADELGCHWADPALELAWPFTSAPTLSARDAGLPPLGEVQSLIPPWRPT